MKWIFRLAYLFVILLILLFAFYWWASSPQLDVSQYSSIDQYEVGTPEVDSTFSIMTYNIGYLSGMYNNKAVMRPKSIFDNHLEQCLVKLKLYQPDIIAAQEIDFHATRSYDVDQSEVMASLGYGFSANVINWDENYLPFPYWPYESQFGGVVSGQSVISKYPVIAQERIALERDPENPFWRDAFYLDRLLQVAKLQIGEDTLIVLNVHLEAYNEELRKRQLEHVLSELEEYVNDYPTILLGDFNSDPRNEDAAIQALIDLDEMKLAELDHSNITATYPSDAPKFRLDYIAYSQRTIEKLDAKVMSDFGTVSDHLPVMMEFKIK